MTLTEFLLARIAEDERAARKLAQTDRRPLLSMASTINHPTRLLAECAAKRRIVERATSLRNPERDEGVAAAFGESVYICAILAAVYADHDDYDEAWRP